MAQPEHHLSNTWHLRAPAEAVFDVVARPANLPVWWPAVFPEVLELEPGDETGAGRILRLEIRGWLPYVLNCHLKVLGMDPGRSLKFEIWGDVVGSGRLTTNQRGEWTDLEFEAAVRFRKSPVRYLARLAWPLFAANHSWAGLQGREGLIEELRKGSAENGLDIAFSDVQAGYTSRPADGTIIALLLASFAGIFLLKRRRKKKNRQ